MVGALAQLGWVLLIAAGVPGPRRPLTWASAACALLFACGMAACLVGAALPIADIWEPAVPTVAGGLSAILLSMWLAQAPDVSPGDPDDGTDDGGGGNKRPPDTPPAPSGPTDVSPPGLDWATFERERARWERDRTPEPV